MSNPSSSPDNAARDPKRNGDGAGPEAGRESPAASDARPELDAQPRPGSQRRPTTQREVHDRLALFASRAVFFFVATTLGYLGAKILSAFTGRPDIAPGMGVVAGGGVALLVVFIESRFARSPVRTISAVTFGLLIGLVLSLVFQPVVEYIVDSVSPVSHPELTSFLNLVSMTLLCYFGVSILLQTRDDFKFIIPYVEFRREVKGRTPLIIDTSCFVDGRIQKLLGTGVLDHRLIVPKFVLEELQGLADSQRRSTRERGRRGLDILREIETSADLRIADYTLSPGEEVDAALIALAAEQEGKLITTDYNLQKNGTVQGVTILNVNDLATALKPNFVPGETLDVKLLREGEGKKQAVGFLDDGTMVVVEDARARIGQDVTVDVTSALQTPAGKMVFGRLRHDGEEV
jgi:uncharacterized protein YacL